jgi:hypothetical protein
MPHPIQTNKALVTDRDGTEFALIAGTDGDRVDLLTIGFGPPEAPSQFAVSGVLGIDTVPPVVPAAEEGDPSWACFDLVPEPALPILDVPDDEDRVTYTAGDPYPRCGSDRVVNIVYGMPPGDLFEQAEREEVALGGRCIGFDDPTHRCLGCHADLWDRPEKNAPEPATGHADREGVEPNGW